MKYLAALLLLCPVLTLAQLRLGLHTGVNFPGSTIPFGQRFVQFETWTWYWFPGGLTLGANVELPVLPWLEITPGVESNLYVFDESLIHAKFPASQEPTGEVTRVYRMVLEARMLHEWENHNRMYLTTGVGYMIERIGDVTLRYGDRTVQWFFNGKEYWGHSLGIGWQIPLSRTLAFDLCAKYYSNYMDRCDLSTNLGLAFVLEE